VFIIVAVYFVTDSAVQKLYDIPSHSETGISEYCEHGEKLPFLLPFFSPCQAGVAQSV
jgi:hypothetical protein